MMQRLRLRGKSIGQIDDEMLVEYQKIAPYKRLNVMVENLIGREILHFPVTSLADLDLAEQYVMNLHYRNIGEYLDTYIRSCLMPRFKICRNCELYNKGFCSKSKNEVHELQKGCDDIILKEELEYR